MGNYQGYQKYKYSGVEWLGDIPKHWKVKRLKNVASCNDEALGENTAPDYEIEYVDISSVDLVSGIRHYENMTFEKAPSRARRKVQNGDTIISTVRTYLKSIAAIKEPPINLIVSTGFAVIRPKININSDYIGYLLQSEGFIGKVVSNSVGVSYPAINSSVLISLPVVEPPLDEQEKIAQFLDYKTKQIDELIKKKETLIEKFDEKRTALISHAVTKGLDPSVPMKDSGIDWLGEIPKHWTILKLGRLCDVTKLTGFEYTKKWQTDPNGEIIALRGFNIKNNQLILNDVEKITSELSNELLRSKLYAGDIVFPCTGTLGEGAIINENNKYHINQNIAKISPVKNIDRKFLLLCLCSKNMKYQIELYNSSGLQPVLLIGTIRSLIISIPDFLEQKQIADYLDKKTAQIDQQKAKIKQAIELLKEYRTSLITNAVTGKIDVRQFSIP
ncbi:MAG TPA: restriction endonuclease subunit S [Nodularia sp. (in: cyanobacteria)]|nr:restriction endonuclease subunit S [Nodularia sp. (in: cyanobacteria)]